MASFTELRISTKLTLVNGLSALLALVVSAAILLELTRAQLQLDFETRIALQTQLVASTLDAAVLFEDWGAAQELASALLTDKAICAAMLIDELDAQKVVVGSSCAQSLDSPQSAFSLTYFSADRVIEETAIIVAAGSQIGRLEVRASNREVGHSLADLFWRLLGTIVGALVLSFLMTARGQRSLLRPVSRLTETVREIQQTGNYRLRGDVTSKDEIGSLTSDVNSMLELIEERDQFLAREIDGRTKDLKAKNDQLEIEIEQRARVDRALSESQARFAKAFENAPIGMAITDSDGNLVQGNDALNRLLGALTLGSPLQSLMSIVESRKFLTDLAAIFSEEKKTIKQLYEIRSLTNDRIFCNLALSGLTDTRGQLDLCIVQVEDVTQAHRLAQELEHQATHDALTGLGNRRVFEAVIQEANQSASKEPFSMALLDLDQFKIVNDTCGHEAGDALLKQIARLLEDAVRPTDTVARLGGDEFALILRDCEESGAYGVAEKVRKEVEAMIFHWEGENFRVGTSIGLVTVSSVQGDASEILRSADAACFAAKDQGRNRVYQVQENDEKLAKAQGEMHWVNRIQRALENDEFVLYAQPIVPLQPSTSVPRMEILVRLRDFENRRLVPPGAFLASAERFGLSTRLDRWVTQNLIRHLKAYKAVFSDEACYWINLSGHSLSDQTFLTELEREIVSANLGVGALNFEVTETAVIADLPTAIAAMKRLKSLGCRFALDDFGSGLSSFGYLRDLPVDFVKIDGAFVRNLLTDELDRIFVQSIIDIVRAMKIKSVAEFVEDDATAELLRQMGADFGQGFGLGKPATLLPLAAYQSPTLASPN